MANLLRGPARVKRAFRCEELDVAGARFNHHRLAVFAGADGRPDTGCATATATATATAIVGVRIHLAGAVTKVVAARAAAPSAWQRRPKLGNRRTKLRQLRFEGVGTGLWFSSVLGGPTTHTHQIKYSVRGSQHLPLHPQACGVAHQNRPKGSTWPSVLAHFLRL